MCSRIELWRQNDRKCNKLPKNHQTVTRPGQNPTLFSGKMTREPATPVLGLRSSPRRRRRLLQHHHDCVSSRGLWGEPMTFNWSVVLVLISFLTECTTLQLEAVLVPQFRFRGQNATLLCKYELDPNEYLFSLKWYKEETEFYRYTPPDQSTQPLINHRPDDLYYVKDGGSGHDRAMPKGNVQTWRVPGIKIDLTESTPQKVELKRVSFKSTGMYRCEVTTIVHNSRGGFGGYPVPRGFHMKESVNRMTVVELPSALPRITGGELDPIEKSIIVYQPGDMLNLTCISAPSNPPAELEWRINGRSVPDQYVLDRHLIDRNRGLFSSVISLLMPLSETHFTPDGELRVKCRGTIAAEFWENDVENVFTDRTKKDRMVRVLEVQESQWPASAKGINPCLALMLVGMSVVYLMESIRTVG